MIDTLLAYRVRPRLASLINRGAEIGWRMGTSPLCAEMHALNVGIPALILLTPI